MSTIPSTPTSVVWPDWTNLVDKWREEDAECTALQHQE